MKKVIVYAAWEKSTANALEQNGKISLDKLTKYEFDTEAEAKAFIKGTEEANGWDSPYVIGGESVGVTNGILHLI